MSRQMTRQDGIKIVNSKYSLVHIHHDLQTHFLLQLYCMYCMCANTVSLCSEELLATFQVGSLSV